MTRFLRSLAAFAALQLFIAGALAVACRGWENFWAREYHGATIQKRDRLAGTPSPRLVLVGGSNVAFSIVSPLLEEELPFSAVNMGLDVNLGLELMLGQVEAALRHGDVVVLSPEYHLLWSDPTNQSLLTFLFVHPQEIPHVGATQLPALLDSGLLFLRDIERCAVDRCRAHDVRDAYRADRFNVFGDFVGHHGALAPGEDPRRAPPPKGARLRPVARRALVRFAARARESGARVFLFLPPTSRAKLDRVGSAYARLERELREIEGIPVLNRLDEVAYAPGDLYDAEYHLQRPAALRHTRLLAERLAAALDIPNRTGAH